MLLIKNGTIVNPAKHQHEVTNILVEDGKIKEIGQNVSAAGKEVEEIFLNKQLNVETLCVLNRIY